MSEANELTYAAIVTISLPGMDGKAAANITLTPGDGIVKDGTIKQLHECTLADLQAFADQLEVDVWETYQSIKLIELTDDEEVVVEVTVEDTKGQTVSLQNWSQQTVLLPAAIDDSQNVVESVVSDNPTWSTTSEETSIPAMLLEDEAVTPETEEHPATEALTPLPEEAPEAEEALPAVMVSESEPVYAEREALDDPGAFPTPSIAPSKARVRIAGRRLPIGHHTWAAVDILIDESALRAAQAHALSSPKHEVAGVLVGPQPEKQPDGRYVVHVIDTIIAKYTVMHGASVTYTPESWRYLNDKLAERYPDETAVMVGWYHTHPGFGIFLSGMDQFIHQNFFTQIWHTALVLDPVARRSGFFCWDRGQARVNLYDFAWPDWAASTW